MASNKWTNNLIFRLIDLFKERQSLWDCCCEEYKDRNKKSDAWEEISRSLNLDRAEVERKMKSLIGQFRRENKPRSGAGADEVSKWFAYRRLLFLKQKNEPRKTISKGIEKQNEQESSDQSQLDRDRTHQKRAKPKTTDERSEEAYGIMKNLYQKIEQKDEFHVFGEYVASKLRKLNSTYAQSTAQHRITNILYSAELGEYDDDGVSGDFFTGYTANKNRVVRSETATEPLVVVVESVASNAETTGTTIATIHQAGRAAPATTTKESEDTDFDSESMDKMLQDINEDKLQIF